VSSSASSSRFFVTAHRAARRVRAPTDIRYSTHRGIPLANDLVIDESLASEGRPETMSHGKLNPHVVHSNNIFGNELGDALLVTILDGAGQGDDAVPDMHLDVRRIDVRVHHQTIADFLANTFVRTTIPLGPAAVVTPTTRILTAIPVRWRHRPGILSRNAERSNLVGTIVAGLIVPGTAWVTAVRHGRSPSNDETEMLQLSFRSVSDQPVRQLDEKALFRR
jgi:hypothetical protein